MYHFVKAALYVKLIIIVGKGRAHYLWYVNDAIMALVMSFNSLGNKAHPSLPMDTTNIILQF